MLAVLPRVSKVTAGFGLGRASISRDQRSVQAYDRPVLDSRAGEEVVERRGVDGDDVDRFVEVTVRSGDAPACVGGQDLQIRRFAKPPQDHDRLRKQQLPPDGDVGAVSCSVLTSRSTPSTTM
ncbi:hypothetical protein ACFOJ6_09275 [Gordonia humi]|uniref:hypothetical protein n=1 Tax=Gordonia humi TaxID=686429 RepID=UPI003622A61F